MNPNPGSRPNAAFTLLELLLTITIIGLLVSLLLPSLERGKVRVRSLQCKSNLHQLGLGMVSFAQAHEDKFPVQVSTNQGGSSEFIDAGNSISGEFYFAYKHFLPLAAEIGTPKLLVCPTDKRTPATNFPALRNTNLSYFVSGNPQFGDTASILSGDRNLTPLTNSIARLRGTQRLKWTSEMHEHKGNVVYADGHVELLNNTLSQPSGAGAPSTFLVMPSAPPITTVGPAVTYGGGGLAGGGAIPGGNLTASFGTGTNLGAATNTSAITLTNLTINSGPPRLPPWPFTTPGPGGIVQAPPIPSMRTQQVAPATPVTSAVPAERTDEEQMQAAHQDLVDTGKDLARRGARAVYFLPWWLIVALLLGCLWLLHRVHNRRGGSVIEKRPEPYHFTGKSS